MLRLLVNTQFQILFHSPARGSFHLSLAVLCSLSVTDVFSLRRWSSRIPTGFHVSRGTREQLRRVMVSSTGLSPAVACFSIQFDYQKPIVTSWIVVDNPKLSHYPVCTTPTAMRTNGLGCSLFARHYWGNRYLLSFPQGTKMFQFPWLTSLFLFIPIGIF